MKLVVLNLVTSLALLSCSNAYGGKKAGPKAVAEPCVAERIEEGVRITCPTSEAVVYDGEAGVDGTDGVDGAQGPQGEQGEQGVQGEKGEPGEAGLNGTSCTVTGAGLVQCGETEYQLPHLSDDTCQVWILPQ